MAQIAEFDSIAGNPAAPLGTVNAAGLADQTTQVTTSGTAANTTLASDTKYVEIVEDAGKDIRVDIGDDVTADSSAYFIAAYGSRGFHLPVSRNNDWRVSIIDA